MVRAKIGMRRVEPAIRYGPGRLRVNPVMVKPSSSMTLKPPPNERYLAKTEKSGSLSPGISLLEVGQISTAAGGRALAGGLSRTCRS